MVEIAAGYQHSLALLSNGSVLSWGSNQAGQLGVPLYGDVDPPSPVGAGGDGNPAGTGGEGKEAAAGKVRQGELGWGVEVHPDNGLPFRTTPALVPGLPLPAVSIAAGFAHSAAVLADGRVFTWGGLRRGYILL